MQQALIYGTSNPAKLKTMRACLAALPLDIVGLEAYKNRLPEIDESGNNPLENARIKALAYFRAINEGAATVTPVFSCDSGLYFDGVPDDEQPGVHVRNIGGKCLTDGEMTAYYAALAAKYGGKLCAKYKNAICLVVSEDETYAYMGDDLSGDTFYMVVEPHQRRMEGFPLDCLSIHIATGKYYYDMDNPLDKTMIGGFAAFFERSLMRGLAQ